MRQAILRWTVYLTALLVVGPIAGLLTGALRAADGGSSATPLVSASPILGLGAGLGALLLALIVGLVGARLCGPRPGMTAAGLVVAWAAWRTGTVDELIRRAQSPAPLWSLALEGLVVGGIGVAMAAAISLLARPPHAGAGPASGATSAPSPAPGGEPLTARLRACFTERRQFLALPVGIVAGAGACWLIAVTPLKGQAFAGAVGAGVAAGAFGHLIAQGVKPPMLMVAVAILAVLGPVTGVVTAGHGGVVAATYAGRLFPVANPLPLDWIAGGLLGIPMGLSWAGSMGEKHG